MLSDFELIQKEFPWFFQILVFVFGSICGSFYNVCIYRIPKEESVITPRSHNHLGQPLAWYDNIPILSWFILRGKDRATGEPFSFRYPFVEILTGALFTAAWMLHTPLHAIALFVLISILICATFIDLDHMIIPDRFSIGGAVIGFVISLLVPQLHGVEQGVPFAFMISGIYSLIGMFIGSALVMWIGLVSGAVLRKETLGFGDVKLLGCIGAFLGWQGGVFAVFGGAVIGVVFVLPVMLCKRVFKKDAPAEETPIAEEDEDATVQGNALPFGPLLSLGALVYLFVAKDWMDQYFSNFSELLFP